MFFYRLHKYYDFKQYLIENKQSLNHQIYFRNQKNVVQLEPKLNTKIGLHTTTTHHHPPPTTTTNFQATSRHTRRLRFGMLTLLTNIRSPKVLYKDGHHPQDGHHPITTFFFFYCMRIWLSEILTGQGFGSQISLPIMLIPKLNTFDLSLV